jgi:hypothetical protein
MLFLVDKTRKIIFGWSAKCGCTHIKNIYYFLINNTIINDDKKLHKEYNINLPNNIEEYTTILFIRNPYKRLVSGFLDKYNSKGNLRHIWKHPNITFYSFINKLVKEEWDIIDFHHFTPQTSEKFDKPLIMNSKTVTIFDIENINYKYIEELYDKSIPEELINYKGPHKRKTYETIFDDDVYYLDMNTYFHCNVNLNQFYNEEIKEKVYKFYKNDFEFFNENGFDYDI